MDSWLTADQIRKDILPKVNRIHSKAGIIWIIEELFVEPASRHNHETPSDWISLSYRSSDSAKRIRDYCELTPLIQSTRVG
jgi:hypothetical protein